jgi:hypothetical protein
MTFRSSQIYSSKSICGLVRGSDCRKSEVAGFGLRNFVGGGSKFEESNLRIVPDSLIELLTACQR